MIILAAVLAVRALFLFGIAWQLGLLGLAGGLAVLAVSIFWAGAHPRRL